MEKQLTTQTLKKLYSFSNEFCEEAIDVLNKFAESGFADKKLLTEISTGEEQKFWASWSEALTYKWLAARFELQKPNRTAGPDFVIDTEQIGAAPNRKLWIEVICPTPNSLPDKWLNDTNDGAVQSLPIDQLLLKVTAAIKEKTQKFHRYCQNGIVDKSDFCVIALNLARLHDGTWQRLPTQSLGSTLTAEVIHSLGCSVVTFDRNSGEQLSLEVETRTEVPKERVGSPTVNVPLGLNSICGGLSISAIAELNFARICHLSETERFTLVLNPSASNHLPNRYISEFAGKSELKQ